jgi:hypothetical protein
MPRAVCEPAIPANKRPQTYALRPRGHWDRQQIVAEGYYLLAAILFISGLKQD